MRRVVDPEDQFIGIIDFRAPKKSWGVSKKGIST